MTKSLIDCLDNNSSKSKKRNLNQEERESIQEKYGKLAQALFQIEFVTRISPYATTVEKVETILKYLPEINNELSPYLHMTPYQLKPIVKKYLSEHKEGFEQAKYEITHTDKAKKLKREADTGYHQVHRTHRTTKPRKEYQFKDKKKKSEEGIQKESRKNDYTPSNIMDLPVEKLIGKDGALTRILRREASLVLE